MADEWFYEVKGDAVGPLTAPQLLNKVRSLEISPDTRLKKNGSAWFPARQVTGLFEAATKQSVTYLCPHCRSEISKPPTTCDGCDRYLTDSVVKTADIPRAVRQEAVRQSAAESSVPKPKATALEEARAKVAERKAQKSASANESPVSEAPSASSESKLQSLAKRAKDLLRSATTLWRS